MALAYATTVRFNMMTQVKTQIDAGSGPGKVRIYDGTRPASGGSATTLLAELTLSDPCGSVTGGVLTLSTITSDTAADATGTATWFRIVDSDNVFVVDGNIGTSGSDLNLNSQGISAGAAVSISSFTITEGNA
jgi:hypothetical protein